MSKDGDKREAYDAGDKARELVGKIAEHLTADELQQMADLIDEGYEMILLDSLVEKAIEKDPSKANDYANTVSK